MRYRWEDSDGAQLEVTRGASGRLYLDTDPDTPGADTMVEIRPEQVDGLIKFLRTGTIPE